MARCFAVSNPRLVSFLEGTGRDDGSVLLSWLSRRIDALQSSSFLYSFSLPTPAASSTRFVLILHKQCSLVPLFGFQQCLAIHPYSALSFSLYASRTANPHPRVQASAYPAWTAPAILLSLAGHHGRP